LAGGKRAAASKPQAALPQNSSLTTYSYVRSLRRLIELPVGIHCLPHHYVLAGRDEVRKFLARSLVVTETFAERVYMLLDEEAGEPDRVLRLLRTEYRVTEPGLQQPVKAYPLNLKAQITHLSKRRKNHGLREVHEQI
jgi:hypothetical protein